MSIVAELEKTLLEVLQCPVAHVPLVPFGDWLYAKDRDTRRKYPIRDGIPCLLADESAVADLDEYDRVMAEQSK